MTSLRKSVTGEKREGGFESVVLATMTQMIFSTRLIPVQNAILATLLLRYSTSMAEQTEKLVL